MSEETTTTDQEAYDIEKEIKALYENLSIEEKRALENFESKINQLLEKAKKNKLAHLEDNPLEFTQQHPEILHPPHLTTSPHEITVYVKAEVSEIDANGHLTEVKDLFEQYYHIPVRHQKDYKLYVSKFFEKFHSNLEITCQEVMAENKNSDA